MEARAAPIGQHPIGTSPSPFSALLELPCLPAPHPRPQPPDRIPLFGWADPGCRGPAELRGHGGLHSLGKPDHCFGGKCQGSLKIQLGPRTCLRLRESDPVPGAACPRGFQTVKASYLQPEPSELLGMPSPTAKTWKELQCLDFNYLVLTGNSNRRIL